MAEDLDEDEIWNYRVKARSIHPNDGLKARKIERKCDSAVKQLHRSELDIIEIDSDDDDIISSKLKKDHQLKEWDFLRVERSEKNNDSHKKKSKKLEKKNRTSKPKVNGISSKNICKKDHLKQKSVIKPNDASNITCSPISLKDSVISKNPGCGKRKSPKQEKDSDEDISDHCGNKKLAVEGNKHQGFPNILMNSPPSSFDSCNDMINERVEKECSLIADIDTNAPKVVNVVVVDYEESVQSNGPDIESHAKVASDLEEAMPGGFFLDDDDDYEKQTSESSQKIQVDLMKPFDFTGSSSEFWGDSKTSPSKARKQTSLYSFFKARPSEKVIKQNSIKDTSESGSQIKSVFDNVISRPSLRPYSSTPSESLRVGGGFETGPNTSGTGKWNKKQCPFYKKIPGTSITVDAFRYGVIPGCQAYFLTHFHYDHYGGLTKKFAQPIYCSQITGNLVRTRLGVDIRWINCLPMWKPCQVADATLTLMEANHCPGAVIALIETKDGKKILHTGDFRACPEMESYTLLNAGAVIDELYLDTTYCNPSYAFPSQKEVIDFVASLVQKYIADHPKTLIVCGAYTIGKEKIFSAIAKVLNSKICVMSDKKKVLDCLEDRELKSRVTLNWSEGQVHVLPMGKLNQKSLFEHHERHTRFTSILAFEPTGWTHSSKSIGLNNLRPKWSSGNITLYGVPYSEHSSFLELKRFVQFLQPRKILPTVNNGNPVTRKKMETIFKAWEDEAKDFGGKATTSQQSKMDLWMA